MQNMRILIYRKRECNPKVCTAVKLGKFGLAKVFYSIKQIPKNSIVLDAFASKVLSREDRKYVKNGIVALDCSWKRIRKLKLHKPVQSRVLPLLVASNPVNYGKIGRLSTAEAISSALYIFGYKDKAEEVLSKFKWGRTFLDLNRKLLEEYHGEIS